MEVREPYPPGGRLLDRPAVAKPCSTCGELAGRGYPSCPSCAELVDGFWVSDWLWLLDTGDVSSGVGAQREFAGAVLAEQSVRYPWTCIDWAMRLLVCAECGAEEGAGRLECLTCAAAEAHRWEWDHAAMPEHMTRNEHELRVAVATLRAPHRRPESVVSTWRLALPFLLVGEVLTAENGRRLRVRALAGRYAELAALDTFTALVHAPDLPWRRWSEPR